MKTVDNDHLRDAAALCAAQQISKWLMRSDIPDVEHELRAATDGMSEYLGRALTPGEELVFELSWYGRWNHVADGYEARKEARRARQLKAAVSGAVAR